MYAAVSSSPQEKSIDEDQRAWAHQTAAENGWTISREFGGVATGKDGVRKVLETLLAELRATPKKERPARVLVTRIDRFGRGVALDTIAAIAEIRRLGVTLYSREDGEITIDRASDAIKPMLRAITGALENEARRDKAKALYDRRRREGKVAGNRAPYGLRIDPASRRYAPDEITGPAVAEAFRLRVGGMSLLDLSHHMSLHAPVHVWKNGNPWRLNWDVWTTQQMLRRRAYAQAGIITQETFEAAQTDLSRWHGWKERSRTKFPWPLSGVLTCACGSPLRGQPSGPQRYRIRYYVCLETSRHPGAPASPRRKKGPGVPWVIRHRADRLERAFAALLSRLQASDELAAALKEHDARRVLGMRVEIGQRIAALEDEISDLEDRADMAWSLAEDGGLPPMELASRLAQIRLEQDKHRAAILELQAAKEFSGRREREVADIAALISGAAKRWAKATAASQKEVARRVVALLGPLVVSYDGALCTEDSLASRLGLCAQRENTRAVAPRGMLLC